MGEEWSSSTQTSCSSTFSFPSTPITDHPEFEFCSVHIPVTTSPADRLFSNGRLLPHRYPCQTAAGSAGATMIITTTTTTSGGDSSRSTSCSARTSSSSDVVDSVPYCRVLQYYYTRVNSSKRAVLLTAGSKRWHYITPVPATMLKRDFSGRKKQASGNGYHHLRRGTAEKKKDKAAGGTGEVRWRRFLRLLCLACEECHAMDPSKNHDLLTHP